MNRQQRREAAKSKPHKSPHRAYKRGMLHEVVARSLTTPTNNSDAQVILMPMHAALLRMDAGTLDVDSFWQIGDAISFGHCLGHVLFDDNTNPEVRDQIAPAAAVFASAMTAWEGVAARHEKTKRFGVDGEQRKLIHNAATWCGDLFDIATQGQVTRALLNAEAIRAEAFRDVKGA